MNILKSALFGFALAGMFLFAGCESNDSKQLSDEMRTEQQELRNDLEQLEKDISAELKQLEADLKSASTDAKSDIQSEIDNLKETRKKVSAQMKELGDATAENWEKFEKDVRDLVEDVEAKINM